MEKDRYNYDLQVVILEIVVLNLHNSTENLLFLFIQYFYGFRKE